MMQPMLSAVNSSEREPLQPTGLSKLVMDYVTRIPMSTEMEQLTPRTRADAIAKRAAMNAGLVAGSLALPPGPLGWLTIIPELIAIWRIQAQMVADIAAAYGKTQAVTRERMVYCLFRHAAAQAVRDVGVRVGERILASQFMQSMGQKIGVRVGERVLGKAFSRFIPIIGAIGVGAYAYYDTNQVAKLAVDFLEESGAPAAAEPKVNELPVITIDAKDIAAITIEK
jgi:hypothetical protein